MKIVLLGNNKKIFGPIQKEFTRTNTEFLSENSIDEYIKNNGQTKEDNLFVIDTEDEKEGEKEIIDKFFSNSILKNSPVIFLANKNNGLIEKLPTDTPIYDFIGKPVNVKELTIRIQRLKELFEKEKELRNKLKDAEKSIRKEKLILTNMVLINKNLSGVPSKNLSHAFIIEIMGVLMTSSVALFIKEGTKKPIYYLKDQKGLDQDKIQDLSVSGKSEMISFLEDSDEILNIDDIVDELNDSEANFFKKVSGSFAVPIIFKDSLVAFLVLGKKITLQPYSDADFNLIRHVCAQFAASFANFQLEEIRGTFSRYVSKDMIDYLLDNPKFLKLGGVNKNAVVMFADIRNFTGISEAHPPEVIVSLLNSYFAFITEIIFKHGGMLDKYIGDCVMAEFGLPLPSYNDQEKATRAALEIQKKIKDLNEKFKDSFKVLLEMGIALHYGELISGNLGSEARMDYTVIGDTVNIAARIEDHAGRKEVLVSDSFYKYLKKFVHGDEMGMVDLKGKKDKMTLYRINHFHDEIVSEYIEKNIPYRVGHFDQVADLNAKIGKLFNFSDDDLREFTLTTKLLDMGWVYLKMPNKNSTLIYTPNDISLIKKIPHINLKKMCEIGGFGGNELMLVNYFRENYDGSGYPKGIKGNKISLWSRICRVSDSYVAMINPRPYKKEPMLQLNVLAEINHFSGSYYDPKIVEKLSFIINESI